MFTEETEKKLRAKRSKTDTKPLKTHLKQHQTDTNDAKTTPISPVIRSSSGAGTPK
jgi:hypothetical protein